MTGFELLQHTSEIGFRATGATLEEAFANAGKALFQVMTDIDRLDQETSRDIHVESESLEALLYDFIDELIYLSQAEELLCRAFDLGITEKGGRYVLTGVAHGQQIGEQVRLQEVKAPTYSDMQITEGEAGWVIEMYLDV